MKNKQNVAAKMVTTLAAAVGLITVPSWGKTVAKGPTQGGTGCWNFADCTANGQTQAGPCYTAPIGYFSHPFYEIVWQATYNCNYDDTTKKFTGSSNYVCTAVLDGECCDTSAPSPNGKCPDADCTPY